MPYWAWNSTNKISRKIGIHKLKSGSEAKIPEVWLKLTDTIMKVADDPGKEMMFILDEFALWIESGRSMQKYHVIWT